MDGTRVVLVKPGDVLVFGNVGKLTPENVVTLERILVERIGLSAVVCFADDIDLAAVSAPVAKED